MKRAVALLMLTLCILLASYIQCNAGDWQFNILGINPADFKDRDWKVLVAGAVASVAVHEFSHWVYAEGHGGGTYDIGRPLTVSMDHYWSSDKSEREMFHRAGFLGQLIVGSILTVVPVTRHMDFTLGFNGLTCVNTALYVATGGSNESTSDIAHLENGNLEGIGYSTGAGILSYINLNKGE